METIISRFYHIIQMIATDSAIHLVLCCHGQMSLFAVSYPVIFIHVRGLRKVENEVRGFKKFENEVRGFKKIENEVSEFKMFEKRCIRPMRSWQ